MRYHDRANSSAASHKFWSETAPHQTPEQLRRHMGPPRQASTPKDHVEEPQKSDDDSSRFEVPRTQQIEPNYIMNSANAPLGETFYVGVMTKEGAEATVKGATAFRLYHRALERGGSVEDTLNLYVVYKQEGGKYSHYRVMSLWVPSSEGHGQKMYYVESKRRASGQPTQLFPSINTLVKYYSTNVHLRRSSRTSNVKVEVFDRSSSSMEDS
ncbi:unnamed protein product, partial [Mesorhabditis spiculigera]